MSFDSLHTGPADRGQLVGFDGQAVPYRLRLLSERRLAELTAEADALHRDVRKSELTLRLCAEAVRHPDTGEPLVSLDGWRCIPRAHIAQCATHYVELAKAERPTDAQLAHVLTQLADLVAELRGQPAGGLEDWRVLFATDLYAYYGRPAQKLSLAQVGYYAVYRSTLADEDKDKDKRE